MKQVVECAFCGVEFEKQIYPSQAAKLRFCCLKHAQQHRREATAKVSKCQRCSKDLSPKELIRLGQERSQYKKKNKGEPTAFCFGCRAKRKEAKKRPDAKDVMTPHYFNCEVCGELFWRETQRTYCSSKCKHIRMHKNCMADPKKHVSMIMRISVGQALRGKKNRVQWAKLVGYGPDELVQHIERTMTAGMTWENYGSAWHIDHILPVSRFNYEKPTDPDFQRCWSLKNLRAMWAKDNIKKSNKIEKPFQPCLAVGF